MQGLPFFSFSSQGAGSLTESQPQSTPLMAPTNAGVTASPLVSQSDTSASSLPEFMRNLLQAMTQEASSEPMVEGQNLAAEEAIDPVAMEQQVSELVAPVLVSTTMDMESIERQRGYQPTLNTSVETDTDALPNLMARVQLTQSAAQAEQTSVKADIQASTPVDSSAENLVKTLTPAALNSSMANMAPVNETTNQNELVHSTLETQAKLAPQTGSALGNPLKDLSLNEKTQPSLLKGSADQSQTLSMMTPLSEATPLTERPLSTEQLASLSANSSSELGSDMGDAIDEMWQQTQTNHRQATAKPNSTVTPSFFEQVQAKLDIPPTDVRFGEQMSKRIGMMVTEQMQTARIQLDPPELGSLEIKVRVQQDQVNVSFASNNHAVRDALEAQAPRLREMLNQQGVDLGNLDVSSQGKQDQGGQGEPQGQGEQFVDEQGVLPSDALDDLEQQIKTIEKDGSVDYFA